MKYTRVRRAVSAVVIDSWDEDRNPEHIKVNGNVTFRPLLNDGDVVQWAGPNGPESLVLAPIQCRISDGIIMHRGGEGVYLAAGGEGCEPSLIQWKATFSNMQAGGWSFKLKPVMFDAVPDGEVDLTMVAPVAGASEPIVRGPAGTGIDNIEVDGAELVVTARSEAGVFEMARIPLEDVVRAEADAAAKSAADSAADNVRTEFTTAATSAKDSATAASESAKAATAKASEASTQAANAKNSAAAAKTSETNSAVSATAAESSATKAENSAGGASASAQSAASKANDAATQASSAASSAAAAENSETNAANSAGSAKDSASSAAASESGAKASAADAESSATAASSSASKAATSEQNAAKSASDAAGRATSAKQDADRAANIANSTSWDGDRLTVNGKTSPSLTGPKGDPGQDGTMTFEDLTPAQRETLKGDKGEPGPPGPPGEPGAAGASTWEDIQGKPAAFPPEAHTHKRDDISDLPDITYQTKDNALVQRYSNGQVGVPLEPAQDQHATSKKYVDDLAHARKVIPIEGAVDLNDYTKTGLYYQAVAKDAASGKNYPSFYGGLLEVVGTDSGVIYQRYIDHGPSGVIRTRSRVSGEWSSWNVLSFNDHKHKSADITDTTNDAGSSEFGGRVLVPREKDGKIFYYSNPTEYREIARKGYVDSVGDRKADKSHKHTMSDITDMPKIANTSAENSLVQRGRDGNFFINAPKWGEQAANKDYVDTALGTAKAYTDSLIVEGDTDATDGKLHIVYE